MTIKPKIMRVGMTTPAIQGSKYTSISWRPRKYQGAFAGFIVKFGFAGSSSGAFKVMDQTIRMMVTMMAARNSIRRRNGHTWTSFCQPGLKGQALRWCVLAKRASRSEEHTSELQSRRDLVCR